MIHQAIPVLHITNADASEAFFCGKLGFQLDFEVPASPAQRDPVYMGVSRDGVAIHLSSHSGDGVAGNAVMFRCDDVDALHAEFVARGVAIHIAPVDQTWGLREFYVLDPDRNSIRFSMPVRA